MIRGAVQVLESPFRIQPSGGATATVTFTDFIACKAIEHVLDTVLLPQSVRARLPLLLMLPALVNVVSS